jgi:hypothetical protein
MLFYEKLELEGAPDGGFSEVRLLNVSTEGVRNYQRDQNKNHTIKYGVGDHPKSLYDLSPIVAAGLQFPFFRSTNERKSPLGCIGSKDSKL